MGVAEESASSVLIHFVMAMALFTDDDLEEIAAPLAESEIIEQHDQPVPRRQTRPQQGENLQVAGPVHRPVRLLQLMPSPHPVAQGCALASSRQRQIA